MNLSRINLNLLVILDVLLQEKHVTKASLRLNLTQSTISTALKQLREIFSDELLIREKNQMVLTEKAKKIGPNISNILRKLQEQVLNEVEFNPKITERTFVIAVNDYLECILMTELMPHLVEKAPNIKFITKSAEYISDSLFEQGGFIDLAVGIYFGTSKSIQLQKLYEERLVCVSAGNNKILTKPLSLDAYLEAKHLNLAQANGSFTTDVDSVLKRMGYSRSIAMSVNHLATAIYLLANSQLIATLPATLVNKARHLVNLRYQPLPFFVPTIPIKQAWHYQFEQDSGHIWLRNMIQQVISVVQLDTIRSKKEETSLKFCPALPP
jgi:DNA-binding transcriptional LysR family regulator